MKEFMFYTIDGYTADIDDQQTENCQILNMIEAKDYEEAKKKFIEEGFEGTYESIICREVTGKRKYLDI